MDSMPFELLVEIFRYLCLDGPLPLRHALCVSKSFHNAAVHSPYLWSTVSLDVQLFEHFRNRTYDQADAFLEQCLRRSGTTPLHLKIHFEGLSYLHPRTSYQWWNDPPSAGPRYRLRRLLQTFGKANVNAFERCASLVLCHSFELVAGVLESLPERLPSLQYLHLSQFEAPLSREPFPECPILKCVHLSADHHVPLRFWGTNFTLVKNLTFEKGAIWGLFDIATLSLFPAIQHLNLLASGTGGYWSGGPEKETQAIQFPHLRTLRVRGIVPRVILAQLEAPALEALYVEADHRGHTSIRALRDSYPYFHCSKLYALLPPTIATINPQWRRRLAALANKCPRLEVVYVSGWMETECEGMPHCTV